MTRSGHPQIRYVPSPRGGFLEHDGELLLCKQGMAHALAGDSARLVRAIVDFVDRPRTRDEIVAHVEALAGRTLDSADVVDEAVALLQAAGVLAPAAPVARAPSRGRLLLGVCGAVAAAGTPELATRLIHAGFEVRVALTRAAARFVSPLVLEAVTHHPVQRDLWQRDLGTPVPHIQLAEWADLVLVCPASATTLSRLAAGDCSELVSAIAVGTRAPVVVVPSMNTAMRRSPQVMRNLARLRDDGCYLLHGGPGEELAHAPARRTPTPGAMPSAAAVVDLACAVAERAPAIDWDALYGASAVPAFCADRFDPDFGEALATRAGSRGRLLDVGTGLGTLAIEAARRGYTATAIDLSARAIERARAGAPGVPVDWRVGDVRALDGQFEVILDRGCLHALAPAARPAWAEAMARLAVPGGWLLIKTFGPSARPTPGTYAFTSDGIAALLGSRFTLDDSWESVFHGPGGDRPPALFCALRRTA